MICCCDHQTGLGALAQFYGLGSLSTAPVWPGDRFVFEFENSWGSGSVFQSHSEIALALEDAGISYDTRSYVLSGVVNPYVKVEGVNRLYWDSGSDLRDAIYHTITQAGWGINGSSVKFESENHPEGWQAPATQRTTAAPSGSAPRGQCDWKTLGVTDYLACQMGITRTSAMVVGALGALVAIVVIGKAAR